MSKDEDAVQAFAKIMIPMIRKVAPAMIAQQIISVQPMTMPHQNKVELRCGTAYLGGKKKGDWFTVYIAIPFRFNASTSMGHGATVKKIKDDYHKWTEETFGPESNDTWFERDDRYYFRSEADQSLFVLKWS